MMFLVVFPLTFVANTFVPTGTMPDWLQAIADWNPISAVTAAVRQLFGNVGATPPDPAWPLQHPVIAALAWSLLLLGVSSFLAIRRFKVATSR
jgi:ABC-2 type transport system permease protein